MNNRHRVLTLRLSGEDWDRLEAVAAKRGFTRAEAARSALLHGIRLADAGHAFNVTRLILLIEYMQAAIDVIITRDHGDVIAELLASAKERVELYHA